MPGGRPQIELEDLPVGWREKMMLIASKGCGVVECMKAIKVSRTTWYNLIDRNPEFRQAALDAKQESQVWWEQLAREGASGENDKVNPTLMIFNLKNRFSDDWNDRKIIEQTNIEIVKTDDELDKAINDLKNKHESE